MAQEIVNFLKRMVRAKDFLFFTNLFDFPWLPKLLDLLD